MFTPRFSLGVRTTDKVRIATPEGKLNNLRHLALFGAVAAANAETVVRTGEGTAVRGTGGAHELQLGSCLFAQP